MWEVVWVSSAVPRKKQNLLNPDFWMAYAFFFFFFSKHLIFKNEISPYDVMLKLYFMDSFPSPKVYFWNLSHVCVTCFFIKTFRKCPYLLNSLTSRIGLKQNSSSCPTQPTNLDGFFFCKIKLKLMKSLNGICAVVLNLCYNQLIMDTRWTRIFMLDCSPPNYQNGYFKQGLHAFRRPVDLASLSLSHQ